jgi:hypothetical protein
VCHPARVLDERLNTAQGLTEQKQSSVIADRNRRSLARANAKADHPAKAPHLSGRHGMPRMMG